MPDAQGTRCKSCGAPIFFAKTTKSPSVPFDAAPQHIYGQDEQGVMQHLGKGHVCHFATCPSREQHRKPPETRSKPPETRSKPANVSTVDRAKPASPGRHPAALEADSIFPPKD